MGLRFNLTPRSNARVATVATIAWDDITGKPTTFADEIISTATGAAGAALSLYQNSASPASGDHPGLVEFYGNDAAGNQTLYGEISAKIFQTTNGNEVGCLTGQVMLHGTMSDALLSTETFLLGYNNPASTNFEYVFRSPNGYQAYVYLESFDSGAAGTELHFWHNSPSPAVSDDVGAIFFDGNDSAGNYQNYCTMRGGHIVSKTSGAEENLWEVVNVQAGDSFYLYNGMVVGSPTGANKGVGTINATAVYDDGVLLTCYPWEAIATGKVDLAYWDDKVANTVIKAEPKRIRKADKKRGRPEIVTEAKPEQVIERRHEPARKFAARLGTEYDPTTLAGQRKHVADKKHLTPYPNPQKFTEANRPSVGAWVQRGVEADELLFHYITLLEDRIAALEAK